MLPQLPRACLGEAAHVRLGAKFQTAGRAGFDARRFQTLADAVGAERALVDLLRLAVEFWNVERAARYAVLAADAVLLLEIDDAVRVLDDGAVGGTRTQASGVFAVHALVLAHQPLQAAV